MFLSNQRSCGLEKVLPLLFFLPPPSHHLAPNVSTVMASVQQSKVKKGPELWPEDQEGEL